MLECWNEICLVRVAFWNLQRDSRILRFTRKLENNLKIILSRNNEITSNSSLARVDNERRLLKN